MAEEQEPETRGAEDRSKDEQSSGHETFVEAAKGAAAGAAAGAAVGAAAAALSARRSGGSDETEEGSTGEPEQPEADGEEGAER